MSKVADSASERAVADDSSSTLWRQLVPFASVVVLGLLLRLAHLIALARTPFFDGLIIDAQGYARDARSVAEHGFIEGGFYRPPLYAYVRAALGVLGMGSPWALRIVHALLGAATSGLLRLIAWRLVPEERPRLRARAAWIAGGTSALYGPLIIYDVELLPQVWVNALVALAYVIAVGARRRLGPADPLAGLCLGLAITGWGPAAVLSLPILALRLQTAFRSSRVWIAAAFLAAMSIPLALTTIHNARHGAAGVVVSGNMGINLWLGNNPRWHETARARPGIYYDVEYQRAVREGAITMPERELYYLRHVFGELLDRPLDGILRTARKLYYVLHGREIRRDQDLQWYREASPVARFLLWENGIMFPFGLLLPVALACPRRGAQMHARDIVLSGVALYALAIALFVMAGRYRLAAVVLLIPIFAISMAAHVDALTSCGTRSLALRWSGLVPLCALISCNLPNAYTAGFAANQTERLLLVGRAYEDKGDFKRSLRAGREAVEASPNDPDAHEQLGQMLMRVGRIAQAAEHFYRAALIVPEAEAPWVLHGQAMLALGQYEHAVLDFSEALARNPYQREALRELARMYTAFEHQEAAVAILRRYMQADYQDDEAAYELTRLVLARNGPADTMQLLNGLTERFPRWLYLRDLTKEVADAVGPKGALGRNAGAPRPP